MKSGILICTALTCLFSFSLFAQTKNPAPLTRNNVRVDDKKPTVYLDFVKTEKRTVTETVGCLTPNCTPRTKTKEFEAVLLKIHNNSKWAIQLSIEVTSLTNDKFELKPVQDFGLTFVALNNIELELMYGVEQVTGNTPVTADLERKPPYLKLIGNLTNAWLPSGRSVVFAVERNELRDNLQIYVPYRYEWETSKKNEGYEEPEHRVYLKWYKLKKLPDYNTTIKTVSKTPVYGTMKSVP